MMVTKWFHFFWLPVIGIVGVAFSAFALSSFKPMAQAGDSLAEHFELIEIGMSEEEVWERLGPPIMWSSKNTNPQPGWTDKQFDVWVGFD